MTREPSPLISSLLRWFLAATFLSGMSGRMYSLILPLYLTRLGADVVQVGLVFTISSVVPLALPIFGGWISDTIGRLRAIALGSLGGLLGMIVMVVAPSWEWMILALSLNGLSGALVDPSTQAFVAEQTPEENRGKVYAVAHNITIVTWAAFPLGGFLAERFNFRFMLLAAGMVYAIATLLYVFLAITARSAARTARERLTLRSLRSSLAIVVGMILAGSLFTWLFVFDHISDIFLYMSEPYQSIYMEKIGGLTVQQISLIPLIGSVIGLLLTIPCGYLSDRYGEHVNLTLAYLSLATSKVIFIFASSFLAYSACAVVFGVAHALGGPAYPSLVSKVIPEERRGIAFGVTSTSRALLSMPSPWIGGLLWDRSSPAMPFIVTATACMGLGVLAWFKLKFSKYNPEGPAAA